MDSGEVVALDIPLARFAISQIAYKDAFAAAVSAALALTTFQLLVTDFQISSAGTTKLFFDIIQGGDDYGIAATSAAVRRLFCAPGGAPAVAGSAACAPLLAALQAQGLPLTGAYYLDQFSASAWTATLLSTAPPSHDRLATWPLADSGEVVSVSMDEGAWAQGQPFYSEAFAAAVSAALASADSLVSVTEFQASRVAGRTHIYFNVLLFSSSPSDTSSAALVNSSIAVASLFAPCRGPGALPLNCDALPALSSALASFGLPVLAFYG